MEERNQPEQVQLDRGAQQVKQIAEEEPGPLVEDTAGCVRSAADLGRVPTALPRNDTMCDLRAGGCEGEADSSPGASVEEEEGAGQLVPESGRGEESALRPDIESAGGLLANACAASNDRVELGLFTATPRTLFTAPFFDREELVPFESDFGGLSDEMGGVSDLANEDKDDCLDEE